LEQLKHNQRSTYYTLPQDARPAPEAAEGRPGDWEQQGGRTEEGYKGTHGAITDQGGGHRAEHWALGTPGPMGASA